MISVTSLKSKYPIPFYIICGLGALVVLKIILEILRFLRNTFTCCSTNLLSRYGQGSYALITGCTSGIGREYAFQLAQKGFNLVLVSRSKLKLEKLKGELSSLYTNQHFVIYDLDFAIDGNADSYQKMFEATKDYDIALLVNNAGQYLSGWFGEIDPQAIQDLINVNVIAPSLITQVYLQKLKQRKNAGIINVSSLNTFWPTPIFQTLSSSKKFLNNFTEGIRMENPDLDIMIVKPGRVSGTNYRPEGVKTNIQSGTAQVHVANVLKEFPNRDYSYGGFRHQLNAFSLKILLLLPAFMVNDFNMKQAFKMKRLNEI